MSKMLYRDPKNGKLGGVCAGVAEYFGLEVWLVRILTVSAFLLGLGFVVLVGYVAACLILDKMPDERSQQQYVYKEHNVKQKSWQAGLPPEQVLRNVELELDHIEKDVRDIEAYVTSSTFNVQREFKNL
ncbi:envelope stress response membrane protein PspC [Photobacterium sanguinicancri]|uniref:Envelope stress response membrane protein PspC n=1 Tax=Photobacterium sanguinicancri TaxID=875932 RepID=A0AAW7Y2I8_9GAMM|nr:envelope stress response membrane protein PspC [Photobacterium sanguinicancri]KXI23787.1 phage shock protein C [Photobacterium sanguinicancri]MDO6497173.1 envelope stress response membrane protein PspC [Photobacterium sanguinicancri]MDO6541158.1 envelope stress response membrane protein PspC [Photobacterium sanguinicancri]OZS43507.1 PspC domain-containing protein [Photobacterium sanguinicancri]